MYVRTIPNYAGKTRFCVISVKYFLSRISKRITLITVGKSDLNISVLKLYLDFRFVLFVFCFVLFVSVCVCVCVWGCAYYLAGVQWKHPMIKTLKQGRCVHLDSIGTIFVYFILFAECESLQQANGQLFLKCVFYNAIIIELM